MVGDVHGNVAHLEQAVLDAVEQGATLCVATELAVTGYPPRDLLLRPDFLGHAWHALEELAGRIADLPPLLVGVAEANHGAVGSPAFNSAALLCEGKVSAVFRKQLLPTYDVFDERRYFEPALADGPPNVFTQDGTTIGVTICEDIWNDKDFWSRHRYYDTDPVTRLHEAGAELIINLSSSPFTLGKQAVRESMLSSVAAKHGLPVLYCNQVGGNDDLVFAGKSMAFDAEGTLFARAKGFEEDILVVDVAAREARIEPDYNMEEMQAWNALVTGTRDYVRKCGFSRGLLGLSGGIDSALTCAIAVEALGRENVLGVLLPSPYSSKGSVDDAKALAANLGVKTVTIPIKGPMRAFDKVLDEVFFDMEPDVTEENIQSRIRGNLLMAMSNKYGAMLLTTGNKSELSVGYCTIYGDMAGGLAVIADVPKTMVYRICNWLNNWRGEIIPKAVMDKPPSAELRPDQTDQDTLPPYDLLDALLEMLVERNMSVEAIVAAGYDAQTTRRVARMVRTAEFKRKQAPPGIKITDRAFGTGWRMPIAGRFAF
jgi:NAD+ synthetase